MKYKNIKIAFISNGEIKNKADSLRLKYWKKGIPVEIEEIVELKMGIEIIPIPDLMSQCGLDAQIASDFKSIYVDLKNYENNTSRFRFSLAHELGHLVLHRVFYEKLNISSMDEIYEFMEEIDADEYSYLETQANKFANYFLVPREELSKIREKILREKLSKKRDISVFDEKTLNSYLAGHIASLFSVSSGTVEIALNDLNNFKK
ncbi:MAG: ImmA/IrrE family metallo-endopeptidase [Candidatus Moraniibacteriota bacterium]